MALPLVLLAAGSLAAGYVGVPHALGGSNAIETFLHPSFHPASVHGAAVAGGAPTAADAAATSLAPVYRLLLNKYYVDEIYDAAIVHPLRDGSSSVLWKTVDARIIDGAVNGTGLLVRESAGALRLLQTGSLRVYAASLFTGVLLVLGYFLAR